MGLEVLQCSLHKLHPGYYFCYINLLGIFYIINCQTCRPLFFFLIRSRSFLALFSYFHSIKISIFLCIKIFNIYIYTYFYGYFYGYFYRSAHLVRSFLAVRSLVRSKYRSAHLVRSFFLAVHSLVCSFFLWIFIYIFSKLDIFIDIFMANLKLRAHTCTYFKNAGPLTSSARNIDILSGSNRSVNCL